MDAVLTGSLVCDGLTQQHNVAWDTTFSLSQLINYIQSTSIELYGRTFLQIYKKYSYLYLAYAVYVSVGSFRRIRTQNTSSHSWAGTTDNILKLPQTGRFSRLDKPIQYPVVSFYLCIVLLVSTVQDLECHYVFFVAFPNRTYSFSEYI